LRDNRRRREVACRTLAVLWLLAAAAVARADGLNLLLQPEFAVSHMSTTAAGLTTFTNTTEFGQLYRLDFDKHIYPYLDLSLGGTFHQIYDWTTSNTGYVESVDTSGNAYITLALGSELLGGSLGYQRVMDAPGLVLSMAPTNVADNYFATFSWRPIDYPSINLRLDRQNTYDSQRTQHDNTTDDILFNVSYRGIDALNLLYSLRWTNSVDHLHDVENSVLSNTAQAIYNDRWFGNRTNVYVSGLLSTATSKTLVQGVGGTVSTQRFPIAGLSLVEAFPATPQLDTLTPNPLLIDGITNVSANIDIGYGPSLIGDKNYRDVGVQFADAVTPVNTFWVYVNQVLPQQVYEAFTWVAYQSSDNLNWTPVAPTGPVVFNTLFNRFEIPIAQTQALYLKVVTTPLPASVTQDPLYRDIFVTEIQVYQIVPAASVQGTLTLTSETANATARTLVLDLPSLFWDLAAYLNRSSQSPVTIWSLINSLSLAQKLTPALGLQARVARLDQNFGLGLQSQFQWSASLTASPFPTLTSALTYNGIWGHDQIGIVSQESVYLFNNAALYDGLSLLVNGGYSVNHGDTGRVTTTSSANLGLTAVPHRSLTLSVTYTLQYVVQSGGPIAPSSGGQGNLTGSIIWTPFPALFFSGSVSRIMQPVNPTTLATVNASFSPFAGGDLLLRFSYNETLDTFNQVDQRTIVPSLRYTIRPGWFLDAGYTIQETRAPQSTQKQNVFQLQLTILL